MKIAMLLDNPYTNDGRVEREAETLVGLGYELTLFAVKSETNLDEELKNGVSVKRIFNSDLYDFKNRKNLSSFIPQIMQFIPDVIHCHDHLMLGLGAEIKRKFPSVILVYDSHELFHSWPLNLSSFNSLSILIKSWIVRKYQIYFEKRNARYLDYLITVNDSLAQNMENWFNLKTKAIVVRNIPSRIELYEKSEILRNIFNIPLNTRILVFIGSSIYLRTLNLEQVIDETGNVSGIALVIISGGGGGKKDIMEYVRSKEYENIYFHPKIPFSEIPKYLSSADVGLVPTWNKKDLSYWYALDNKLFEYMMGGIPVLATQQPEYRAVVETYNTGLCVNPDNKNAYIDGFNDIIANYDLYKLNVVKAVNELNWENESRFLTEFYSLLEIRQ